MTWRLVGLAVGGVVLLLAMFLLLVDRDIFDRKLTVAVSTEEPALQVAEAMRPFIEEMSFSWEIHPYSDLAEMSKAIQDGTVDFAIRAEPPMPVPGVRTLVPLYPSILHVLYKADREPKDMGDVVTGRKIYAGPVGSVAHRLLMLVARDYSLKDSDYEILESPWGVEPDVYFILGGLLSTKAIMDFKGYRIFGFGDPSDLGTGTAAEAIALRYRNAKPFVLPQGIYPGLSDRPVLTLAVRTILMANAKLPDARAYFIASALFQNAQSIAAAYPLVTETLNPDFDPMTLTLPIHPGARLYIERNEPGFIERYAETFAFGITAIAALASVIVWVRRERHQRRKDKVDVYYANVLELRARIARERSQEGLLALRQQLLGLQSEVFELLIDERVEANVSFVVFLELSNQVLKELDMQERLAS